jgi:hypothetical protein
MPFLAYDDTKGYPLPDSILHLFGLSPNSVHCGTTLSQVKIIDMMIDGGETRSPSYNIFIGVMRTNRKSNIIIIGEYYRNVPSSDDLFQHIEVFDSERIDLEHESDPLDILNIQYSTHAILLKTGVIIIGVTPRFEIYVKRFDFVRDITNSPFNTPIIYCRSSIHKQMTSSVEKCDDNNSIIHLNFRCVCSCSNSDCLTKTHWSTENCIRIYISNKEIKIDDSRYITTNERCVVDGEYNDFPTIRDFEENDSRYHEITYELSFPEDESEEEED